MSDILFFFIIGGVFFVFFYIFFFYLIKKLKKILKKKYLPETASSFKCLDGHVVRSKAELIIDNFLYNNGIKHVYENTIKIKGSSIKYDWYLPDHDIYIEYWGYFGKEYMKRKEEKIRLYKKGNLCLVSIEDIMFKDLYHHLKELLKKDIEFMDSKKHCPNCGILLDERF
ncbi:MAG: hypothetical protein EU539_08345 [Promethearchaeota archaeon]|nr:MAG: hypothetical protein EU539_08345 [Candidatus Lokiarchaeota archaeon]